MTPRRRQPSTLELYELIWDTVSRVPPGRVAAYGQIAAAAGLPGRGRLVGKALRSLPDRSAVPWYRVINAQGRISLPPEGPAELQQSLLESEGIVFTGGRIDLERFGWEGRLSE